LARAVRDLDRARDGESLRGPLVQQLARIEQRLTVLREQADGLSVNRANLDEHRHAVHIQRGTVQRLQREAEKWRNEMMEARERIARLEADLEQLDLERMQRDRAVRDLDDAKRRRDEAERRRVALDYYRQAVDRGGIPSLLLEQLAPQLQARVNDILSPVGRQIRIDTERVTTTGRTKTEVTLRLMSPTSGNEFVPIAEASGGEEDLLNMAMSAGLARVASDMSGAPLSFVALDEPAAGVSESLQAETLEVIGRVHEHVQRSLTITHRRDLAAAFDGVIEVQQNGAGSTVEVQR
jgi:exonuclease SbcC